MPRRHKQMQEWLEEQCKTDPDDIHTPEVQIGSPTSYNFAQYQGQV